MARSVAYDDSPLYILLTDETNRCPSEDARFFIYGGLIFPVEHLATLHSKIEYIRLKAGYRAGDSLSLILIQDLSRLRLKTQLRQRDR